MTYGSRLPLIDALSKGKGILVEKEKLLSTFQTAINLTMEEVDKRVNDHLQKFDAWNKRNNFGKYDHIKTLEAILEWVETQVIPDALNRREFLAMILQSLLLEDCYRRNWTILIP